MGLADNGDFSRVASPLGIFPPCRDDRSGVENPFLLFNAVFDVTQIGLVLWVWTLLRNRGRSSSVEV